MKTGYCPLFFPVLPQEANQVTIHAEGVIARDVLLQIIEQSPLVFRYSYTKFEAAEEDAGLARALVLTPACPLVTV